MADIFRLLTSDPEDAGKAPECRIGLNVRLGGRDMDCPVSGRCSSTAELGREIEALKADLDRILQETETLFGRTAPGGGPEFSPGMTAEEIWSALSGMPDDEAFAASFNGMGEAGRREVAEYVLTRCNIFSGRAAFFSARFDAETALIQ
jgi:hypothetical protein